MKQHRRCHTVSRVEITSEWKTRKCVDVRVIHDPAKFQAIPVCSQNPSPTLHASCCKWWNSVLWSEETITKAHDWLLVKINDLMQISPVVSDHPAFFLYRLMLNSKIERVLSRSVFDRMESFFWEFRHLNTSHRLRFLP